MKDAKSILCELNSQQTKQTEQEKYHHEEEQSEDEKCNLRGLGEKYSLSHVNKTTDTQIQNEINKDYALEGTEVKDGN